MAEAAVTRAFKDVITAFGILVEFGRSNDPSLYIPATTTAQQLQFNALQLSLWIAVGALIEEVQKESIEFRRLESVKKEAN